MTWLRLGLFLCAAMGCARSASCETLITSLSTHRVQITSTYTGVQLVIFGTIERDARTVSRGDPLDMVITVKGPRRTIIVREKEPLGPLWINRSQRRFVEAPSFISVATNRPLEQLADAEQRRRLQLGVGNILQPPLAGLDLDAGEAHFRDALIRLGAADGLFSEQPRGVTFLSPTLFRSPVNLPGVAPPGTYDVDITLMVGSVPIAKQSTNFEVVTTGFEQRLKQVARRAGGVYGLATVFLALSFGWLASVIFRRD